MLVLFWTSTVLQIEAPAAAGDNGEKRATLSEMKRLTNSLTLDGGNPVA